MRLYGYVLDSIEIKALGALQQAVAVGGLLSQALSVGGVLTGTSSGGSRSADLPASGAASSAPALTLPVSVRPVTAEVKHTVAQAESERKFLQSLQQQDVPLDRVRLLKTRLSLSPVFLTAARFMCAAAHRSVARLSLASPLPAQ